MNQAIINFYRRLDEAQRGKWFHIIASVVVAVGVGWYFGSLLALTYSLDSQRQTLAAALTSQSIQRGDQHALSLRSTGTVTVDGRTYGNERYLKPRVPIFDKDGNIINIGMLVESFLVDQRPKWAPSWLVDEVTTTWILGLASLALLLLIVWTNATVPFVITALATAVPVTIFALLGKTQWMLGFAGIGLLTFTFLLLTRVAQLALNQAWQVTAVAHTVLKEASRRGLAQVFIVLLLVVLPLLPLLLSPGSPLRFRLQTYISWSLGLTFTIAAVMTLFFSCASVAFEIRDRQIWQLMTKPLARLNYLLGKWLGVMVLNLIILVVAGACTFTFIQYLSDLPVDPTEAGQLDMQAVSEEVLTARVGAKPEIPALEPEQLRARVNQRIQDDPELSQLEKIPSAARIRYEQQIQMEYSAGQRSVPPMDSRVFVFSGLGAAKNYSSTLSLRYKFYILADDEHKTFRAGFVFNDDRSKAVPSTYVPSIFHAMTIPSSWINDDGTLQMRIVNLDQMGAINFEEGNLELMYKAGSFEGNFVRALLTIWVKLAFLAALGIACATFLSFPVACLLAFTVFVGGMIGPFLAESLEWYNTYEMSELDWSNIGMVLQWMFDTVTIAISNVIVFLLSSFGEYRPTQSLVEGRLIAWETVAMGFAKLGLLWSGLAMIVGYIVLRKRQLAIYSGHG